MSKMTVTIDVFANGTCGYTEDGERIPAETLEDAIIAAAAEKVLAIDVPDETAPNGYSRADRVRALLMERIEAAVEERVKEFSLAEAEKAVLAVIGEGWQRTDEYGTPRGERMTLKQRVSEILNGKADSYQRETRLENITRLAVENALKTEFDAELAKARAAFKAQLDGVLQAKLRESLAGALGLKA